jgi:CheY-like chemotaxis protein
MVDDNPRFLTHLSAKLDSSFHFNLMTDPREASVLGKESKLLLQETILNSFVYDPDLELEDEHTDLSIHKNYHGVRLAALINLIQDSSRFDEISVIIVDYSMPGMNGIEFCRAIEKHPAKKILLTGEADHRIAVDAFNQGLIHRFILKQTQENLLYEELNSAINELQNVYFSVNSRKILSTLGLEGLFSNSYLVDFINKLCVEKKYIEFYLLNSRGALLFLDEEGRSQVFICETLKNLNSYALIARDNEASNLVIRSLEYCTHLPYLLSAENEDLPFDKWENYLLPATHLLGTDLFYALTTHLPYGFAVKKIQNYSVFMEQHLKTEASFNK